jgi:hypothetical protein
MNFSSYCLKRVLRIVLPAALLLCLGACGDSETASDANPAASAAAPRAASTTELDVCALIRSDEIAQVIGQPAGGAKPEQPYPPLFSCRYEDDAITPAVQVSVAAWDSEDTAAESFDIASQYPRVSGIGDRAYNSQPFGDLTVLHGRYEVSVDVAFLGTDSDVDLDAAVQIARIVIDRLQ